MTKVLLWLALSVLAVLALVWAARRRASAPAASSQKQVAPTVGALVPPGELRAGAADFTFGIYYLTRPSVDPVERTRALLHAAGFTAVDPDSDAPAPALPYAMVKSEPVHEMPPPAASGLPPDVRARLPQAASLTLLVFMTRAQLDASDYRRALTIVRELARGSDSIVYDPQTLTTYTPEQMTVPVDGWHGSAPDVTRHIRLLASPQGDRLRLISHGMEKLGLPDLLIDDVAPHDRAAMMMLANLVLQTLVERSRIERSGELPIVHAGHAATVQLTIAESGPDDPPNRLLQLDFPGPAETLHARQHALLEMLFGAGPAHHDPS